MNQQSIECECGCWNIVLKVVPPGEPCPYCGSSEPHDMCPEKAKALGIELPEPCIPPIEEAKPGDKKYNIFQFERCDCGCTTLHYVEADEECPAMRKAEVAKAVRDGRTCCRGDGAVARAMRIAGIGRPPRKCHNDAKWTPYGRQRTSCVGQVEKRGHKSTDKSCAKPPPCPNTVR